MPRSRQTYSWNQWLPGARAAISSSVTDDMQLAMKTIPASTAARAAGISPQEVAIPHRPVGARSSGAARR